MRRRFFVYHKGSFGEPFRELMGDGVSDISQVKNADAPRCVACVMGQFNSYQCLSPGKEQDENGLWWCNRHSPSADKKYYERESAKDKKRQELLDQSRVADKIKRDNITRKENFHNVMLEALRKIASGHNDPRTLAKDLLDEYETNNPSEDS